MLGGCVNQFADNYKTIATPSNPLYIPSSSELEIKETKNLNGDLQQYLEMGYAVIGTSNFSARSGSQNLQNLKNHAKTVGAQTVLVNRSHGGSSTVTLPLQLLQQQLANLDQITTSIIIMAAIVQLMGIQLLQLTVHKHNMYL